MAFNKYGSPDKQHVYIEEDIQDDEYNVDEKAPEDEEKDDEAG